MTLTQQIMSLESATINMEVFKGMKTGANAMKQIHGQMNVDKVDETMEEINETMDVAKEISDVISQPVGDPLDEDDLLEELNELEEEALESKMLDEVPTSAVQVTGDADSAELEELRQLEAS